MRAFKALTQVAIHMHNTPQYAWMHDVQGPLKAHGHGFQILSQNLSLDTPDGEGKVFFYKMKGDYYRYIAEYATSEKKNQSSQKALQAYNDACIVAKETLQPTDPNKLGLSLNQSVFYKEIMMNPEKALQIAR